MQEKVRGREGEGKRKGEDQQMPGGNIQANTYPQSNTSGGRENKRLNKMGKPKKKA